MSSDMQDVSLKLPDETLKALRLIARQEDISPGQVIRNAISRDLQRRSKAKTARRADERLVAPLRALLAEDLAFSQSWEELLVRLRAQGFALAEAGGGLVLNDLNGMRLCKASELGYSYSKLMQRFTSPFPT